jgi:hypothetical protein
LILTAHFQAQIATPKLNCKGGGQECPSHMTL